ncbi:hypothetical protein XENOCAPTIV_012838 [Xenoophorus captivus]|uniref:Uncharacterized protein n=1 Tax=Xenoophorus captivus TaxID=1517983 RepID=A0ABV0RKP0_9TELE
MRQGRGCGPAGVSGALLVAGAPLLARVERAADDAASREVGSVRHGRAADVVGRRGGTRCPWRRSTAEEVGRRNTKTGKSSTHTDLHTITELKHGISTFHSESGRDTGSRWQTTQREQLKAQTRRLKTEAKQQWAEDATTQLMFQLQHEELQSRIKF